MTAPILSPQLPTGTKARSHRRDQVALTITNEYGNVDLRKPLSKRYAHISGKRLPSLCRKLGINFAPALLSFKGGKRFGYSPVIDGVVVSARVAERLRQAIVEREARARTPKQKQTAWDRRQERDVAAFATKIRARFPRMPEREVIGCASHTTAIGSGRVGRSSTANDPVRAAVVAHVRHEHTEYEELLAVGYDRYEACEAVWEDIGDVLAKWEAPEDESLAPPLTVRNAAPVA